MIVRSDLGAGIQACQGMHVAIKFQHEHNELAREWTNNSDYICFLNVKTERDIAELIEKAKLKDIKMSIFQESDLDGQTTAVCLAPCEEVKKLCSQFPLALKEKRE